MTERSDQPSSSGFNARLSMGFIADLGIAQNQAEASQLRASFWLGPASVRIGFFGLRNFLETNLIFDCYKFTI